MLIGGLVGGFILFMWQFLSWSMLNIHRPQNQYTEAQNQILSCLKDANLAEGSYMLPNVPDGTSSEEHQKAMDAYLGKPWAQVSYHNAMSMDMGMNMFRGFIVNFLSVFLLCYLLVGQHDLDFMKVLLASLAVGMIAYMTQPYLTSIWFKTNSIPDLIDTVVQGGLAGIFLGWFLNRN